MIPTEPQGRARGHALDRRQLLKGGMIGMGLFAAPLGAQAPGDGFTHGVASGEPGQNTVLLWTRCVGEAEIALEWQVAEDENFTRIASEGFAKASPARDWCAKAVAEGLAPGQWYYYRFIAPDGSMSDVGRTRTLPDGPVARWRMAVFSCANLGFGWFNAYAHAAEAGDFDMVVHTGDYLYEYPEGTYPDRMMDGRRLWPDHETVTLADYRLRHAAYRADPDLRRLHQLWPMVMGWDDHESTNDSYADGAENHQPDTEGDWQVRKGAAMRAYREWLPVSDEPWARYEIGELATLFRLETRLTARSQPPSLAELLKGAAGRDEMIARLTAFREGAYADPARTVLGDAQELWLADGLKSSRRSGRTWQVLAQQVVMGRFASPAELVEGLAGEAPDWLRGRLLAAAAASRAGLPANMDAWDGYPAARERLLAAAREADANLVTLTGDTHNAWAFQLEHAGEAAGIEFAGQSVTSPGFESYLTTIAPADLSKAMVSDNPQLSWAETSRRGYMAVELTPTRASCEWRMMAGVRERSTRLAGSHSMASMAGSNRFDAG
ncbi:MAG: alkaline phosphatase [Erythrobacter sp. 34-65-8]|nr:MAG: alkaline phosphatase [Erythrobacter sp. 34-65-8]